MKTDAFEAWYRTHAKHILSNDEYAQDSYDVLTKAEKLHLYERLIEERHKKKPVNWELILRAVSIVLNLTFNLFLCGCIFAYEMHAPIISKVFNFIKPMSIV